MSNYQQIDFSISHTPTVSHFCGFGQPPIDKPQKNMSEECRKKATYPAFYLRSETNDYNTCILYKPPQLQSLIQSMQLAHAICTRKIDIRDFFDVSNHTPEQIVKWAAAASIPVTPEIVNERLSAPLKLSKEEDNWDE